MEQHDSKSLINENPQQNLFQFGPINFDSRFDSGNLWKVINPEPSKVY